jgi:hypothetical protein
MKSPWKFLAQFIPQRRSTETRAASTEYDPDADRGQSEAQKSLDHPLGQTEASDGSEQEKSRPAEPVTTSTPSQFEPKIDPPPAVSVPGHVKEPRAPARRQTTRSNARSHAMRVERQPNKTSPPTPLTKKLERAKTTDAVAQSAADANRGSAAQVSPSRDTFFDEVAGLDEDIKQLRIQLARKLHLQNVQLTKMLKRFDIS